MSNIQLYEEFARGGGGGSSSGGGGSTGGYSTGYYTSPTATNSGTGAPASAFTIIVFVSFFAFIVFVIIAVKLIAKNQNAKTEQAVNQAAATDSAWDETALLERAKTVFMQYQQDWSNGQAEPMHQYLTDDYFAHVSLLLQALQLLGRRDNMQNVDIKSAAITDMNDSDDNAKDSFTVQFAATARDELQDATDGTTLFTDNSVFMEYWHFVRRGDTWLLAGISQSTADASQDNAAIKQLAQQNGYYYSEDMGWLFLPKRGQLFGGARFGTSDINNHVIGLYNNQLLVQVYAYIQDPQNNSQSYVIAQVNVPKQYGQIVVRRKSLLSFGIHGLEKVETEWTQFNKEYEVFASAPEQVTSFELLNPTYMEQLAALPFNVGIEVVDNVIYLYTAERGSDTSTYQTMLDLVEKAFKELRL